MNTLSVIVLLFVLILIIIIINKIYILRENFEQYKLKVDTDNDYTRLKSAPGNIFVGADDVSKDEDGNISPGARINETVNLGTNNTIFIKDKIMFGRKEFDIDFMRNIKYLPYHFNDKMCIGNACINKNNIKFMKGKMPFTINTFTNLRPFQVFSEPGFTGWKMSLGTSSVENLTINNNPMKSIKIAGELYMITAYEEPNFGGKSYDITSSTSDLTTIFPEGVKSVIPKSIKGNLLNNTCLAGETLKKTPNWDEAYGAVPCDSVENPETKYFYFLRPELMINDDVIDHTGREVHFHTHDGLELLHDS